jgi:hypothetical protein
MNSGQQTGWSREASGGQEDATASFSRRLGGPFFPGLGEFGADITPFGLGGNRYVKVTFHSFRMAD